LKNYHYHNFYLRKMVVVEFEVAWWCDPMIRTPLLLPSPAPEESGNPCRNDKAGVSEPEHFDFNHY